MSSIIRNKRVLILLENHTQFISVYPRAEDDAKEIGEWLLREMRSAVESCLDKNVTFPDIRLTTTMLSQKEYDILEVKDYEKHVWLLGDPR